MTLIDEYINKQDPEHRSNLRTVRDTIREQLPSVEERISWSGLLPCWPSSESGGAEGQTR